MKLKITDKNGITLYTAGTYCAENIEIGVDPSILGELPDGYIIPEGQKDITENGVHDITSYASVNVEVPVPDGYIIPAGNFVISENGDYNISDKESVTVNVESAGSGEDYLAAAMNDTLKTYKTDKVDTIRMYSFYKNTKLHTLDTTATTIESSALNYCYGLHHLVLRGDSVASLASSSSFYSYFYNSNYPTGHIFVPDSLVDSYKSATNWSSTSLSNKIYPLSSLTPFAYVTSHEITTGSADNITAYNEHVYSVSVSSSKKTTLRLNIHVPEGCNSFVVGFYSSGTARARLFEVDSDVIRYEYVNDPRTELYENIAAGNHYVDIYLDSSGGTSGTGYVYFRALPLND